jgi:hypothetical protein
VPYDGTTARRTGLVAFGFKAALLGPCKDQKARTGYWKALAMVENVQVSVLAFTGVAATASSPLAPETPPSTHQQRLTKLQVRIGTPRVLSKASTAAVASYKLRDCSSDEDEGQCMR